LTLFWPFLVLFGGGSFGPFGSAKEMTAFGWKKGEKWPFLVFFGVFGVFFYCLFWGLFFFSFFGGREFQLSYNLLVATRKHGLSKREQYFHSEFHHVETIG